MRALIDQLYNLKEKEGLGVYPVAESVKAHLSRNLKDIGIPPGVCMKLEYHNITKVIELTNYDYRQLRKLKGISATDAGRLEAVIASLGLSLDTDIRWVPGLEDYLMFSPNSPYLNATKVTKQRPETMILRKKLADQNEELRYAKQKESNLYSTISELKLKLVQKQDELKSQKKELKRLRIIEKKYYRKK